MFDTLPSTIVRHILVGYELTTGERIHPEGAERRPGGWFLSADSLNDFYRRITTDRLGRDSVQAHRTAEHNAAEAACAALNL